MVVSLLSFSLGTGHGKVAETLAAEFRRSGVGAAISPLEAWVPAEYDLLFRKGYLFLALALPWVWEAMYASPRLGRREELCPRALRGRAVRAFEQEGLHNSPAILATQINAMEIAADWKRAHGGSFPIVALLTDWDIYPLWARKEVDLYLLPHPDLAQPLQALGVSPDRIAAPGIPVDPAFEAKSHGKEALLPLGLRDDRPTALLAGGGLGVGPLAETAMEILRDPEWQILLVCGKNARLRKGLVHLAQENPDRLRVLGFRSDMPALLSAADVFLTKGGGLSLTEALHAGVPTVALPGLTGQEKANLRFMGEREWIEVCADPRQALSMARRAACRGRKPCPLPPSPAAACATAILDVMGKA